MTIYNQGDVLLVPYPFTEVHRVPLYCVWGLTSVLQYMCHINVSPSNILNCFGLSKGK